MMKLMKAYAMLVVAVGLTLAMCYVGVPMVKPMVTTHISHVAVATEGPDLNGGYCTLDDLKKLKDLADSMGGTVAAFSSHNHVKRSVHDDGFSMIGHWKDFYVDISGEKAVLRATFVPTSHYRLTEEWAGIVELAEVAGHTIGVSVVIRVGSDRPLVDGRKSWSPRTFVSIDWVNHPAANPRGIDLPKYPRVP